MIGGLKENTFHAPLMFEGHCDTKLFEKYLEKVLLPILEPGITIVLDNASFHKSAKIKALVSDAGCHLKYLPPYSPDLNPIEHWWYKIKNAIKKMMRNQKYCLRDAMELTLKELVDF